MIDSVFQTEIMFQSILTENQIIIDIIYFIIDLPLMQILAEPKISHNLTKFRFKIGKNNTKIQVIFLVMLEIRLGTVYNQNKNQNPQDTIFN